MQQLNLFGEIPERPKPSIPNPFPDDEDFKELEKRIAQEYGRRHIGYPCDVAQDMLIDDRPQHIKNCPECQELIKKLDAIAYGNRN